MLLLLCAFICGVAATFNFPSKPWFNWLPAAFTFFILYLLLGKY